MLYAVITEYLKTKKSRLLTDELRLPYTKDWNCFLYALAAALFIMHDLGKLKTLPPPARKRDRKFAVAHHGQKLFDFDKPSLRRQAKDYFNSAVFEVFDPEDFSGFIKEISQDELDTELFFQATSEKQYIKTLVSAVDNKKTAIVFFDVGISEKDCGQAVTGQGNVHAAVIVGYQQQRGILYFHVFQRGEEHTIKAKDLFKSAQQLEVNPDKYNQPHYKVKPSKAPSFWCPERHYNSNKDHSRENKTRTITNTLPNDLKGAILIIDRQEAKLSHSPCNPNASA